jgi:hypothetical protein
MRFFYYIRIVAIIAIFQVKPQSVANAVNLLDMADKLDKLDQKDLQSVLNKADDCTQVRNFTCSEEQLRKAAKLVHGSKDKQALNKASQNLQAEKKRVKEEALARSEEERQIRLAEERQAEEERIAEQRRLMAQNESASSSSTNYAQSFAQGVNEAFNQQNKLTRIQNDTIADINRAAQERQAQAEADRRAASEQRAKEKERIRQQNRTRREQEQERLQQQIRQQDQERQKKQALLQEKERQQELVRQKEQERKHEQARQKELIRQKEQELKQEQARQKELTRKKAEEAAAKLAEQKAKKQAEDQYLKSLAAGSRLVATKCPDGEGKYYATGKRPSIKPDVVECVDLHFRAYCPGNTQYTSGVAHNFIGMAGCFGDTYEISPTPPCKVDQVQLKVIKAVGCK